MGFLVYQLVITFCVLVPTKLIQFALLISMAMRILRIVKLSRLIHSQAMRREHSVLLFYLLDC